MTAIMPTLFCGGNAAEMVKYYTSIFKGSQIEKEVGYPPVAKTAPHGYKEGDTLAITFSLLDGALKMTAINGPPNTFLFNEAISFTVVTEDQEETDYYWDRLTADGNEKKQHCCWCQDKFGLWWQVIPKEYMALMEGGDRMKAAKAMEVCMTWKKADLAGLKRALREIEE